MSIIQMLKRYYCKILPWLWWVYVGGQTTPPKQSPHMARGE